MSSRPYADDSDDDWHLSASEQRREITAAKELDADLDLAFHLQLQEAINASLTLQDSASASASTATPAPSLQDVTELPPSKHGASVSSSDLQSEELLKMEQELTDRKLSQSEFDKARNDLHRRIHDKKLAQEISEMSDDDWENFGDNFEKPYGEGSSTSVSNEVFAVYFKGLVEKEVAVKEHTSDKRPTYGEIFSGIGVAICDSQGELLFQLSKPLYGTGINLAIIEFKALLMALNIALNLDLKRVVFHCHYYPLYQYVTRRWMPKQKKVIPLVNQVIELGGKFVSCQPSLVTGSDVRFAFKLARDAIEAQVNKPVESSGGRVYETCVICLEDSVADHFFSVDGCKHRYCYSCMKQHVEVKMLYGMIPKCPHESCDSELKVDSCSKFLTLKLVERLEQRMKEASIPAAERVYCPYPKCSALMSKTEALEYSQSSPLTGEQRARAGAAMCVKCKNLFCINCRVPWHNNMTCADYKRRHPLPPAEDVKLKNLAEMKLWRQCIKCNHMIELDTGCYHMTCRCGYEFCYTCGAEWKDKKATCSCPLWDEEHLLADSDDDFDIDDDEEDEEEDEEDAELDYDTEYNPIYIAGL